MASEVIRTVRSAIREKCGKFEREMDCWHYQITLLIKILDHCKQKPEKNINYLLTENVEVIAF